MRGRSSSLTPAAASAQGRKGPRLADEAGYCRANVNPRDWQKLRRGRLEPSRTLDLHGSLVSEALALVERFTREAAAEGQRCVCIVHGKSRRAGEPTIKQALRHRLPDLPVVLAWCPLIDSDGGSGAMKLLLRQRP